MNLNYAHQLKALLVEYNFDERVLEAADYAEDLHRGQKRLSPIGRGKSPYIEHPLRVALRLADFGVVDENVIITALLHDAVEDQVRRIAPSEEEAFAVLADKYSVRVSENLRLLTNPPTSQGANPAQKRQEYQNHVRESLAQRKVDYFLVKASDYLDNGANIAVTLDNPGRAFHFFLKYKPLPDLFLENLEQWARYHLDTGVYAPLKNALLDAKNTNLLVSQYLNTLQK